MDKSHAAPGPHPHDSLRGQPSHPIRRGPRALHQQIADELRRQIEAGELRPGDPLPSENALMRRYGVSRGTVRQARAALRADGTIGGSQGRPLAVRGAALTQPLGELISFSAWVRSVGRQPSGRVVEFGPRPADDAAAATLGLKPGEMVVRLVRVRFADDEPLMIERTVFPPAIGELLTGIDLDQRSIYAELARHGIVVASARHLISALPAGADDARLLRVAPRAALLRVQRQAFSPSGEPLEWSDDRYRGDRVNFAIENSALVSGVVRRLA